MTPSGGMRCVDDARVSRRHFFSNRRLWFFETGMHTVLTGHQKTAHTCLFFFGDREKNLRRLFLTRGCASTRRLERKRKESRSF